jgi:DNA-directed RNA polymerases I and III subunit RPAC1
MSKFTHYTVQSDIQIPDLNTVVKPSGANFVTDFQQKLKINVIELDEEHIVFDLIGVDASIANAMRRILLAEVPTVAIETIYMHTNTSIIQDEVLSHRVGLVPIKVDPEKLQDYSEEEGPTDLNTIVFKLDVECPQEPEGFVSKDGQPYTHTVYSKDLEWQPQGNQEEMFPDGVAPVHPDIVLARLRPGQSVEFEAHCRRGVGKDHAKYSPCATAFYRLLPDVQFHAPVRGALATELKALCPMNVFDIEDSVAVTARPRDCTMCRECIRTDGWENGDRVKLTRVADHYIFTVESTGCLPPEVLVRQAIGILKQKAITFMHYAEQYDEGAAAADPDAMET